jgi:hypothetical protein
MQAENEDVGLELQKQLEAAGNTTLQYFESLHLARSLLCYNWLNT